MAYTDDIDPEVLNAMHVLAAAMDCKKTTDGLTALHINEEEEKIVYENFASGRTVRVNISGDSQVGAIIDFARHILLRGN